MGLPQGTVTFVFTDLEGSTRRWETHPAEMREALARHNSIVQEAIVSHGGVGALLLCHLKGVPISRSEDQTGGRGGNFFSFDARSRRMLSGWKRIEA